VRRMLMTMNSVMVVVALFIIAFAKIILCSM